MKKGNWDKMDSFIWSSMAELMFLFRSPWHYRGRTMLNGWLAVSCNREKQMLLNKIALFGMHTEWKQKFPQRSCKQSKCSAFTTILCPSWEGWKSGWGRAGEVFTYLFDIPIHTLCRSIYFISKPTIQSWYYLLFLLIYWHQNHKLFEIKSV